MDNTVTTSTAIVDPKVEQSFQIILLLVHAYPLFFMQARYSSLFSPKRWESWLLTCLL